MELIDQEASTILVIKGQDHVVTRLIEVVVVYGLGLIHHNLLSISVNRSHDSLLLGRQVVIVEVFVFHKEYLAARPCRGVVLPLEFENLHAVVISCGEIVHGWVCGQNPESISVLSLLVDLNSSVHIPDSHSLVL